MERHIQSGISFLILAALVWVGSTIVDLRDESKISRTEITEIKFQLNAMNSRFDQYLPRNEAAAKFESEAFKHKEIDRRLDSIEGRRTR